METQTGNLPATKGPGRGLVALLAAAFAAFVVMLSPAAAFAQTPQEDAEAAAGTALTGIGTSTVGFIVTYGIPAIALILTVSIFASLLIKWGRKLPRIGG